MIEKISKNVSAKIRENPYIAIDVIKTNQLFFSKTKSDCNRIQFGDTDDLWPTTVEVEIPEQEDITKEFSARSEDKETLLKQIRKLSNIISNITDGAEYLRWLSKTLRQVHFEDFEDVNVDEEMITIKPFGIF
jgi:hypothetical protein